MKFGTNCSDKQNISIIEEDNISRKIKNMKCTNLFHCVLSNNTKFIIKNLSKMTI